MGIDRDLITDRPSDAPSPYGGWRVHASRLIWAKLITAASPLIVKVEGLYPGRDYGFKISGAGARLMVRLVGARVEVRGRRRLPAGGSVLTPNHRSAFDIAAMMAAFPTARFAGKQELFDDPVVGAPARAMGMVPIDRANPDAAKQALHDASKKRAGGQLIMFPEGVVAPRDSMQPFRSGAFVFAIQTQMPIVPVAIHSSAGVMPDDGGRVTILGGRVVVELLEPIQTRGMTLDDRGTLKEHTRKAIMEALRPVDGGLSPRPDLGSFRRRAFGVR